MFESLFGTEIPLALRFFIAFAFVLGLIGVTAWAVRRFGADRLGTSTARGRQPRLAVIDAAAVDGRRRLVLIRRDNVEHLLMIGGPSDVVVELNIVRATPSARDTAPVRPTIVAEPPARAAPPADATGMWPSQPEPAPRPQRVPAMMEEPIQWPIEPEPSAAPRRPTRGADTLAGLAAELSRSQDLPRAAAATEPAMPPLSVGREREAPRERDTERDWEPPREVARERDTGREPTRERESARDTLREPVREPTREREPAREALREPIREPVREREPAREVLREPIREPVREREPAREVLRETPRAREPQPSITDPEYSATADQNLADMARHLEAALRRPQRAPEGRSAEAARPMADVGPPEPDEPETAEVSAPFVPPPPPPPSRLLRAVETAPSDEKTLRAEPKRAEPKRAEPKRPDPKRPEPRQQKSVYDSLEQEMASLLGRPNSKP
jgi:flagellar protein FliO/FliZ